MLTGLDRPCLQDEFGAMVGLSQPRVAQLLAEGVLLRGGTAGQWLACYCDRLRVQASDRSNALTVARTRLTRERALAQRIRNDELCADYAPRALLEDALATVSVAVAAQIAASAQQIGTLCPGLDADAADQVGAIFERARAEWLRSTQQLDDQLHLQDAQAEEQAEEQTGAEVEFDEFDEFDEAEPE
jgi:hypothetical protein